jgi:hypothetical protein
MTLLRWEALKEAIEYEKLSRRLVVTPLLDFDRQIGPASVDLKAWHRVPRAASYR